MYHFRRVDRKEAARKVLTYYECFRITHILCYGMLWYDVTNDNLRDYMLRYEIPMLLYEIPMLWYEIPMLYSAMLWFML